MVGQLCPKVRAVVSPKLRSPDRSQSVVPPPPCQLPLCQSLLPTWSTGPGMSCVWGWRTGLGRRDGPGGEIGASLHRNQKQLFKLAIHS